MNILFYMPDPIRSQSTGMKTHVYEVLGNLHRMGHVIRYVNGSVYIPELEEVNTAPDRENQKKSLWLRLSSRAASLPVKGEAWLLLNLLKELKVFFSATFTVTFHRPDVIYRRYNHFNSDYFIARMFDIPLVKEANSLGYDELAISGRVDSFILWLYKRMERYMYPRADKIIAVTPELKQLFQSRYGIEPGKITVIQNGANTDLFHPMDKVTVREELGLNHDSFYLCFVGLLIRWQGIEYLLRSMPLILEQYPGVKLLIVGNGPETKDMKALAEQIGVLSNVIFTGRVAYHKVPLYINASDVCVAPFIKELGEKGALCSLKMHEYMACGKPVIMSRLKGIEEMELSQRLIAVEPENIAELSKAVVMLIRNSEMRQQIGNNGREYVLKNQSWQKVSERVADVLYSSMSQKRGEHQ